VHVLAIWTLMLLAAGEADRAGPIHRGDDADARALLGKPAPALPALRWLDGKARSNRSLRGRVVVIRNFTSGCPFCASTLPALAELHRELGPRGVDVLGVYHPKPPRPVADDEARGHARALGASFPVAVDPDWALVKAWWQDLGGSQWTSVTWVLDRRGRLRWVHPGGEYHGGGGGAHARCRADEQRLRALLDTLLRE
jgi:thiol-disulfide isomerase/thioredoxin